MRSSRMAPKTAPPGALFVILSARTGWPRRLKSPRNSSSNSPRRPGREVDARIVLRPADLAGPGGPRGKNARRECSGSVQLRGESTRPPRRGARNGTWRCPRMTSRRAFDYRAGEAERLIHVGLGFLGAAVHDLGETDSGVSAGQIPIQRQRALAFGNATRTSRLRDIDGQRQSRCCPRQRRTPRASLG
jgi:hypothetical protein